MVCAMENDHLVEEMDIEVLSSMWPEDINEAGRQFNVEKPGGDQDMLEEVTIIEEPTIVDFKRLLELTNYSEKGSSQLAYLVKNWEYKQANAVRLLKEEVDNLNKQRQEVELKKLEILEEHRFEEVRYGGDKRPISILDEVYDIWEEVPRRRNVVVVQDKGLEIDAKCDTILYWKQKAVHLEKLLEASVQREQILMEKLQESIKDLERQSSPVEELSQILKRADNFLHFVLQNAPVVIGHQDKELRYRFIYNHFPSLHEEDIIGKTDVEIFTGAGVRESQDFKREVLERGLPAKREITFETELFGSKTFLIYVEPVFSKAGETIGVNYMGMDVTDQVRKTEKMAKLREEIAVQKAKETELNKTIHITEETMRAKQMLATMSHEIRSPLSGVVSMAEILSTTKLDKEQRQLLNVMLSSGDLVLQLINDILDLSKVESGVMKLEATKFRPREVVKHVLQTSAASLQKILMLEGHVSDDVPVEVTGDVLRIRQILTNLISNAIKFTHEGKVGIKLYVVSEPNSGDIGNGCHKKIIADDHTPVMSMMKEDESGLSTSESVVNKMKGFRGVDKQGGEDPNYHNQYTSNDIEPKTTPVKSGVSMDGDDDDDDDEKTVWIRCDVHDTGIGIPETALPTLFKKYMQVGADTARKYGGTGLGLAICKQLVELMGGHLTVSSREHVGSTFTFVLPYKVSPICNNNDSDDPDEFPDMEADCNNDDDDEDASSGFFQFQPRTLGSLFSSSSTGRTQKLSSATNFGFNTSNKLNGHESEEDMYSFPSYNINISTPPKEIGEDACSVVVDALETPSEPETSKSTATYYNSSPEADNKRGRGIAKQCLNGLCKDSTHSSSSSSSTSKKVEDDKITMHREDIPQETCVSVTQEIRNSLQCTNTEISKPALKPKILLVEDNKINVMVTQSMMKQLGHTIDVVNNGVEAILAIQRRTYNLILMDVCMPVMDGLQATKLIRSFEETGNWDAAVNAGIEQLLLPPDSFPNGQEHHASIKRIPIIAMTANALSESADECFANGMDSFVSKPVTFQKLKQCLEQYLP